MKNGVLGADGAIRCPKCGSTSFRLKRSFKAKATIGVTGVVTLGVGAAAGVLAAPKRVKCLACGELYKARAEAPATPAGPGPAALPPGPDGERPVGAATLLLKRTMAFGPALDEVQAIRPDLDREQIKALIKSTKNSSQVLLYNRPRAEVDQAAARLKKLRMPHEVI